MIRSLAAALTLAAGWSLTDLNLDRLRWNARERTATGIENLEGGGQQHAIEAFEAAARLNADDPTLRFNAGSAHLTLGSEGAMEHLEAAASAAPDALLPAASYNLGNARLAAGDPAGAIEAYENALRSDPRHENSKFNLELALRQQQQQEEQQQQQGEKSDEESDKEDPENQQPSTGDQQQEQEPGENPPPEQQQGDGEQNQQLPQFEEQPDMTAEQAAAILEAVENLEREQRRKQAQEEAKKRPRKGKDW